jgi:hypothetical protein
MGSRYLLFGGFDGKSTFDDLWWLVPEDDPIVKRMISSPKNLAEEMETGNETSALAELQKRLEISVKFPTAGLQIVDELEDKELLELGERVSSNGHSSGIQVVRNKWRKSSPRSIQIKELGPLLRDYQRLIARRYLAKSGSDSQSFDYGFPGKEAFKFYHIKNASQLRIDDIPKLLEEYRRLLPD